MTIIEPYDDEEMVYDKENHRYKLTQAGTITEANGFQYIDGSLLPSVIQKMAITAVLAKSWVVPGIACTEEFQEELIQIRYGAFGSKCKLTLALLQEQLDQMVQQTIMELLTLRHPLLQQPFHLKLNRIVNLVLEHIVISF